MAWTKSSRSVPFALSRRRHGRRGCAPGRCCAAAIVVLICCRAVSRCPDNSAFVPFRRLMPSWILHAEVDDGRAAAVAAVPPLEWAQAHDDWQIHDEPQDAAVEQAETEANADDREASGAFEEPFEETGNSLLEEQEQTADAEVVKRDPLELVQSVVQTLMVAGSSSHEAANTSEAAPQGIAAAGAFFTLAAGMVSSEAASLLKAAMFTEDAAVRALSTAPPAAIEEALKALSSAGAQEAFPAMLASSVLVASALAAAVSGGNAGGAVAGEVLGGYAEGVDALNATFQKIWERGTGSLGTKASLLLEQAGKLWAAFDNELSSDEAIAPQSSDELGDGTSHGIAIRSGSARREGKDWILPLEAQLFRRNEGRHAMVLGLCRQLLFGTLHGVSDSDFNDEASRRLYEERARLIFRSLQLPLASDRALQRLEVRIAGRKDERGGWRKLPPTDAYGLVEANVRFADDEIPLKDRLRGRVSVEVRLAEESTASSASSEDLAPIAVPARAVAHLVGQEGLGVISDIDDTVKVTEVFHGTKAVLQNTFLRTFQPVQGMAELFRGWEDLGASFFYVSKSPPELHGPLSEFLHNEGFPVSSLHLCPLLGRDRANFKLRQVSSLLEQFPGRKFLLVGDSGEKDAEVYAAIMRKYPDQVVKALIRVVAPGERGHADRATAAFAGLDEQKWQVFSDPSEVTLPKTENDDSFSWPMWLRLPKVSAPSPGKAMVEATTESLRSLGWKQASIPLAGVVVE
eukprot:gb/GFBE01065570.1/.p1 GENE.gb/GFBE01065570.1/~~gb/GFBE01065570.1/.p1  ORF type:complete len:745 (+),score=177.80 gb/GFBE01065570.1/:1-2235(+)